jgi:hypothetical protein
MARVIRSKGFAWVSNEHLQMLYWSHAGKSFQMKPHARWWAGVPQEQWPGGERRAAIERDMGDAGSDRRQALVFIGIDMDRLAVERELDACLLDEVEMKRYEAFANESEQAEAKRREQVKQSEVGQGRRAKQLKLLSAMYAHAMLDGR